MPSSCLCISSEDRWLRFALRDGTPHLEKPKIPFGTSCIFLPSSDSARCLRRCRRRNSRTSLGTARTSSVFRSSLCCFALSGSFQIPSKLVGATNLAMRYPNIAIPNKNSIRFRYPRFIPIQNTPKLSQVKVRNHSFPSCLQAASVWLTGLPFRHGAQWAPLKA